MGKKVERLMEEGYVSTGNSGVDFRVYQVYDPKWDKDDYRFEVGHSAYGHRSQFSTPIFSSSHAKTLSEVFDRIRGQLELTEAEGRISQYDSRPGAGCSVRNGIRYEDDHRYYVIGPNEEIGLYVGTKLIHTGTGKQIDYEPTPKAELIERIREELDSLYRYGYGSNEGSTGSNTRAGRMESIAYMLREPSLYTRDQFGYEVVYDRRRKIGTGMRIMPGNYLSILVDETPLPAWTLAEYDTSVQDALGPDQEEGDETDIG